MIRPAAFFSQFVPPALTKAHADSLKRDGYCIVDNSVSAEEVKVLRRELLVLRDERFQKTMQSKSIRSDLVRWIDGEGESSVLASTVKALKGVGSFFEEALGHALDAPSRCMAALYSPPGEAGEHSGYQPHLDHRPPDDDDLYWVWKSSREQSERVLTSILYLNDEDWDEEANGGQLRMFLNCTDRDDVTTAMNVVDVAPVGGRLVVFKSRELPHAVLPIKGGTERLALSCWHLQSEDTS